MEFFQVTIILPEHLVLRRDKAHCNVNLLAPNSEQLSAQKLLVGRKSLPSFLLE